MRRKRSISLAVVFALGAVAAVIVPSAPAAAQVNEVTNWNRIATDTLVQFPGLAGGAPPALAINMGMVQGAVYDAVNAIEPMHDRTCSRRPSPRPPRRRRPWRPPPTRSCPNIIASGPRHDPVPAQHGSSLTRACRRPSPVRTPRRWQPSQRPVQDRRDRRRDCRGQRDDRRTAGRRTLRPITVGPEHRTRLHWQPLLPNGTSPLDPTPWVGRVEPFLMQSSSQFRSDGPNALTSNRTRRKSTRSRRSAATVGGTPSARTPEQTHNALFWQSAGARSSVERCRPGPGRGPELRRRPR